MTFQQSGAHVTHVKPGASPAPNPGLICLKLPDIAESNNSVSKLNGSLVCQGTR
jgi:hypothetical protein